MWKRSTGGASRKADTRVSHGRASGGTEQETYKQQATAGIATTHEITGFVVHATKKVYHRVAAT